MNRFRTLHAQKGHIFVFLGTINLPLSRNLIEEVMEATWTGNYFFENEWQSFRTIKNKEIEIKTSEKLIY